MVNITTPVAYDNSVDQDQKVLKVVHCASEYGILMDRDANAAANILSLLPDGLQPGFENEHRPTGLQRGHQAY